MAAPSPATSSRPAGGSSTWRRTRSSFRSSCTTACSRRTTSSRRTPRSSPSRRTSTATDCRLPRPEGFRLPAHPPAGGARPLGWRRPARGRASDRRQLAPGAGATCPTDGETYGWSKDTEWRKFLRLPRRTGSAFELALSGQQPRHEAELRAPRLRCARSARPGRRPRRLPRLHPRRAWRVHGRQGPEHPLLRTGWFSDRSATFLAAGRPVVTQDTAFGAVLPTGEGLFAVSDLDEAVAAIERDRGRTRQRTGARQPRSHASTSTPSACSAVSCRTWEWPTRPRGTMRKQPDTDHASDSPAAHRDCTATRRVLALIPHFECEQYLDDCLAALTAADPPARRHRRDRRRLRRRRRSTSCAAIPT